MKYWLISVVYLIVVLVVFLFLRNPNPHNEPEGRQENFLSFFAALVWPATILGFLVLRFIKFMDGYDDWL